MNEHLPITSDKEFWLGDVNTKEPQHTTCDKCDLIIDFSKRSVECRRCGRGGNFLPHQYSIKNGKHYVNNRELDTYFSNL